MTFLDLNPRLESLFLFLQNLKLVMIDQVMNQTRALFKKNTVERGEKK